MMLKRLKVSGPGKRDAEISFGSGLTLITGPSDTGKSHVLACIDFALGSSDRPKSFAHSEGYECVHLDVDCDGNRFVISRSFSDPTFAYITPGSLERPDISSRRRVHTQISEGPDPSDTLSGWLLHKAGFELSTPVVKNQEGDHQRLSFRTLAPLILVDEIRVIEENSPAIPSHQPQQTASKSIFFIVATGNGPTVRELAEIKEHNQRREKAGQQIKVIAPLISSLQAELRDSDYSRSDVEEELDRIEAELSGISEIVTKSGERAQKLIDARNEALGAADVAAKESAAQAELVDRFKLLHAHYEVDIRRLEFVIEGGHFFDQIRASHCPTCGREIALEDDCHPESGDSSRIESSARQEIHKLNARMRDLGDAINDAESRRTEALAEHERQARLAERLDVDLDEVANPQAEAARDRVERISTRRRILEQQLFRFRELDHYTGIQESARSLQRQGKASFRPEQDSEVLQKFAGSVELILRDWSYPVSIGVSFDVDETDIEIDGEGRTSHGKGVRAVTHAAFVSGLMRHCRAVGLPHPGFFVVDSPLTPFRGLSDDQVDPALRESVRRGMLFSLANGGASGQALVIENIDAPEGLHEVALVHEFRGDDASGSERAGFYPG